MYILSCLYRPIIPWAKRKLIPRPKHCHSTPNDQIHYTDECNYYTPSLQYNNKNENNANVFHPL